MKDKQATNVAKKSCNTKIWRMGPKITMNKSAYTNPWVTFIFICFCFIALNELVDLGTLQKIFRNFAVP